MKDVAELLIELLTNSVEADASEIHIKLELNDRYHLRIEDNGKGIHPDKLPTITSPFSTSRITRKTGFGLAFFKQAIEQANGEISIQSNQTTMIEAHWDSQHFDAPPLGNIGETIAFILQRKPDLNCVVDIIKQEKLNTFNSKEISEVIHPLTFSEVAIVAWVEDSINSLL